MGFFKKREEKKEESSLQPFYYVNRERSLAGEASFDDNQMRNQDLTQVP